MLHPRKINMEPKTHQIEKEHHLPNFHFLGSMLVFRGSRCDSKSLRLISRWTMCMAILGVELRGPHQDRQGVIRFFEEIFFWILHPGRLTCSHHHGNLVQIIFLSKWVICRFMLIFQGVYTPPNIEPDNHPI